MANELHTLAAMANSTSSAIQQLIEEEQIDINTPHTEYGTKAIEFAAQTGNLEVVTYLIQAGADLDVHFGKHNLLYWAKQNPDPNILRYLSDPQNNIIEKFGDKTNELHVAVINENIDEVSKLLTNKPQLLIAQNINEETPLFWGAYFNLETVVNAITSHATFINQTDSNKYDPIKMGQAHRHYRTARNNLATDTDTANMALLEAITLFNSLETKVHDYYYTLGEFYYNLALCFEKAYRAPNNDWYKSQQINQMIDALTEAIKYFNQYDNKHDITLEKISNCYEILGNGYMELKCMDQAISNIQQAIVQCNMQTIPDTIRIHDLTTLVECYLSDKKLDNEAGKWGFTTEEVPSDGSCFFHAALIQLKQSTTFDSALTHIDLRSQTVDHMRQNFELYKDFIDTDSEYYLEYAANPETWSDNLMNQAFSRQFNVTLVIINHDGTEPIIIKRPKPVQTLYFGYVTELHYKVLKAIPNAVPTKSIQQAIDKASTDAIEIKPVEQSGQTVFKKPKVEDTQQIGSPVIITNNRNAIFYPGNSSEANNTNSNNQNTDFKIK